METTKLTTIEDVSQALLAELSLPGDEHRAMKPAARRARAARIADLFEIRMRMFAELLERLHEVVLPAGITDVAMATSRGIDADRDSERFWRNLAGAR